MHLLAVQKRLKDEYEDTDVLPKVNKADMAEMMESIKSKSDHIMVSLEHLLHM